MKKIIALLITLVFMFVMTACESEEASGDKGGNGGTQNSQAGDDKGNGENGGNSGGTTENNPNVFEGVVFGEFGGDHKFTFTKKDGNTASLILEKTTMTATAEETAQLGIKGGIEVKEVYTYDVTYTENNGVYTASGNIKALSGKIEGKGAEDFKKLALENLTEESNLDKIIKRIYKGETITQISEIENYTYKIGEVFNITFTLKDGEMTVSGFDVKYTEFGSQRKMKEVNTLVLGSGNNIRISKIELFENDVISEKTEYNEVGNSPKDVWKTVTYYEEGKVSSVEKYDFSGNEIN